MEENVWHALSEKELFVLLRTGKSGLSSEEAEKRIERYGYNELKEEKKTTPLELFINQFKSFLIIVLIVAAIISLVLGEILDATAIIAIVFLNAVLGFVQEYRANKALEALKKMTSPHAVVVREGHKKEILSKELVPGDVIFLEEGRQIPADSRLIEANSIQTDESSLTGESVPVDKDANTLQKEVPIAEMKNTVFMGTYCSRGSGLAVVTSTGTETEMGRIAKVVQTSEKDMSPLQQKLERMGKTLTVIILILVTLIFFINFYAHSGGMLELFLISVSLAISAIPEALPAVITLTLAMGMQTMAKNKAIVKRLLAVETLGATSVICSDKTGTLTRNEMTASEIFAGNKMYSVTGTGYAPDGEFFLGNRKITPKRIKELELVLRIGRFCNNSSLVKEKKEWTVTGDPTEGALVVAAEKAGLPFSKSNFVSENPFTSERKAMSVVYKHQGKFISYVKGSPELIVENSTKVALNGRIKKLTKEMKSKLLAESHKMAGEPLRVLGFSYKMLGTKKKSYSVADTEKDMIFAGFVGMIDPPRTEIITSIKDAQDAGIKTVMITGDHKVTAIAIARTIGILRGNEIAVTGLELDSMSDEELDGIIENVSVFARISPEHKVRILEAFKSRGHVVAVTGDGVNDAPAIKKADIGVAMGIKGTDVTKEASDMVLQDDNYGTIVKAVKSGREIYDNIRKFIKFMLSTNFKELFLVGVVALAGLPLPFIPLQILWINLVTDSLPALALAVDTPEPNIMERKPRKKTEGIFSGSILPFIIVAGVIGTLTSIWLFVHSLPHGIDYARTMVFTLAVFFELIFVFNCRSEHRSVFRINPFSNMKLVAAVVFTLMLQVFVIYAPFMQGIFGTVPLNLRDWALIISLSLTGLFISPMFFKKPAEEAT
ncbi:MAG: cation-translocating P-type ATPase [Candidatus Nanoarchaeia archaeon]|nr:cation-translocating P-type ATPase [Candidatus Nanoarchaeia archaeon]MDD5239407.1 cation-translocating P-type ATPase [Candidatus Nanoarchaeia archaeon]